MKLLLNLTSKFVFIVSLGYCLLSSQQIEAQTGVLIKGTSGTVDPSAMLEVNSTSLGLLIPRMTTAQRDAISSPATGLVVYNTTTNEFNYYNSGWIAIPTGSGVLPVANGGTGATTASGARTNLGLTIGTDVPSPTGTGASGTWGINISGNAATATLASTVTTNANLTGAVTSSGNATSLGSFSSANLSGALTDETGTGAAVFATSPALTTPNLGTPSAATLTNATGLPLTTGVTGILPVANGGTGVTTSTGSGNVVLSNSPTLVTPNLGTPSTLVGTNITGTAAGLSIGGNAATVTTNANLTGPITSIGNATSVASQTGTGSTFVMQASPTLTTPNLGTPSAATLTNATGLPLTTGVTGTLPVANGGTGVTTSTGSGNVVLSTSPTLTTPNLGTPSAATLTNATGLPLTTGVTGTLPVGNGGTGATSLTGLVLGNGTSAMTAVTNSSGLAGALSDETGTGAAVFSTSPSLTTPNIGAATGTSLSTTGSVTANSFIKTSGTASEYLMADGSVLGKPAGATVATSQTTTSTTYTDLTTVGPSVTVTIGSTGLAIVILTAQAMGPANGDEVYMSFAATGVAAADSRAFVSATRNAGDLPKGSAVFYVTGLTVGSNTFTAKYRTSAGTATFVDRNIIVIPL